MSTISASTTSTTAFKITTDTTGALVFQTGASPTTAMTLDTSQNVLVGMASYGVTNAGVSLSPTASSSFYVAGGAAVTIGRGTSDGTAVQFNRSGTNVGTIAVATTGLTMTGTNGITFTGTQTASSDANTLDDYEEGTWTPTITSLSNLSSVTTTTARYVKIGKTVVCNIQFAVTSSAAGTIYFVITGPFPMASINNTGQIGTFNCYPYAGTYKQCGYVIDNAGAEATTMYCEGYVSAGASFSIYMQLSYITDV